MHELYDLKGSTSGRIVNEKLEFNPRIVMKDNNWILRNKYLALGPLKHDLFMDQICKDVAVILYIIIYSI